MVKGPTWIIDTSAFNRLHRGQAYRPDLWKERIDRGLVFILSPTRLEIGTLAQSGKERRRLFMIPPLSLLPVEYLTPRIENRADEVQTQLADHGWHRAPGPHDLLLAAAGEILGHTVLHDDRDFELIAEVTGQSVERLELTA